MKLSLLLLLLSFSAFAQKHMMIIGAGGEPFEQDGKKLKHTMFDMDLERLGKFSQASGDWKSDIIYNGGHSDAEAKAKAYFNYDSQNQKFTQKSFEDLISKYEQLIEAGRVSQLLIHINSHGALQSDIEKTHQIATAEGVAKDLNNLTSTPTVSLDRLKKLTQLAKVKGIKLAIVDLSCHSGSSLSLANDNTCVITSTGPNHFAYGGGNESLFASKFNLGLQSGRNLEDVFLDARSKHNDPSFPMISTPKGKEVNKVLYEGITPYLFYSLDAKDKLTPYFDKLVDQGLICEGESQVNTLLKEVSDLVKFANYDSAAVVDEFTRAVRKYYAYQANIRKWFATSSPRLLNRPERFCAQIVSKYGSSRTCKEYTIKELMTLNADPLIAMSKKESDAISKANVEIFQKVKAFQKDYFAKNPNIGESEKFWASRNYQKQSEKLRDDVVAAQRKIYQLLYKESKATGANPCRDFVL